MARGRKRVSSERREWERDGHNQAPDDSGVDKVLTQGVDKVPVQGLERMDGEEVGSRT